VAGHEHYSCCPCLVSATHFIHHEDSKDKHSKQEDRKEHSQALPPLPRPRG